MRKIIIGLAALVSFSVHADCLWVPEASEERVRVLESWAAHSKSTGKVPGCVLRLRGDSQKEFRAYTRFEFLCRLSPGLEVKVSRQNFCCEGDGSTQLVCGVAALGPGENAPALQAEVRPARPDGRAIPDLIAALEAGDARDLSFARNLMAGLLVSALRDDFQEYIPRLRKLFSTANSIDLQAAVAEVLLFVDRSPPDFVGLHLSVVRGSSAHLSLAARGSLRELAARSLDGERIVGVLIELLGRHRSVEGRELLVGSLLHHKEHVRRHLSKIPKTLHQADPLWVRLVCESLSEKSGVMESRVIFDETQKISPVQCAR